MAISPISTAKFSSPEASSCAQAACCDKIRETVCKLTAQALIELNDPAAVLSDRILDLTLLRKTPEERSSSPKEFFKIISEEDFIFDPSQTEKLYDLVKEFKIGTRLCFIDLLGLSIFKRLNILTDYIDTWHELKKGSKPHFFRVFFGIYASFTLEMNVVQNPKVCEIVQRDFDAFMHDLKQTVISAHLSRKSATNISKKSSLRSLSSSFLDKAFHLKENKVLEELNSLKELFFAFLQSSCPKDLLFDKRAAQCQGIVDIHALQTKEREQIVQEIKDYSCFIAHLLDHFDEVTSSTTKKSVDFFSKIEKDVESILVEDGIEGASSLRKEVSFFMDSRLEALDKVKRMINLNTAKDPITIQKKRELQLRFFHEIIKIGIAIDYANDLEWITDVIVLPFLDQTHHPKITRYNRVELLFNAILHPQRKEDFKEQPFSQQIKELKKTVFLRLEELYLIQTEIFYEREVAPKASGDAYSLFNFEKKFLLRIYDLILPAINFSISELEELALRFEGGFSDAEFAQTTFWIAQLLMMKEDLEILLFFRRPTTYDEMMNPIHQLLIYSKDQELLEIKDLEPSQAHLEPIAVSEKSPIKASSECKKESDQTERKFKSTYPFEKARSSKFNPISVLEEKMKPKGRRAALSEEEGKRLWELRTKHTRYLMRELEEMGWIVCRPTNGSHSPVAAVNEKGEMKRWATLPNKREIAPGTLRSLIRQLESSSLES